MDAYMALVFLFAGNFAPRGWALCWGQVVSIAQNSALFALLGTTFGGNGQTTFQLPDLRGRVPVGAGQGLGLPNVNLGEIAGTQNVTLTINNMPAHTHIATVSSLSAVMPATAQLGTSATPGSTLAPAKLPTIGSGPTAQAIKGYGAADGSTTMPPATVTGTVTNGLTGNNNPFSVLNPYLGMNYCIVTEGIFPSRN